MAKKKKKKSSRPSAKAKANHSKKKYTAKKKNPGVSLATVKRLLGGKKKKKGRKSHRNPAFLGMSGSEALYSSAAVLGAVTGAKLLLPLFPASWTATDMGRAGTTALIAAGEVLAAHFLFPRYRTLVLAGAGAQTLSVALNPLLRKFSSNITLGRIRQAQSLRDFVPGNFPEPHNPIWQQMVAAGGPQSGVSMGSGRYSPRYQ